MGQYEAAASEYKKAYDLNPASGDYALYQYAIMKGLLKDHQSKIATIDNLVSRFPLRGCFPRLCSRKPRASRHSVTPRRPSGLTTNS